MSNFRRITPTASRDIENIMDYLAEKVSVETAQCFLEKINSKFQLLVKFPRRELEFRDCKTFARVREKRYRTFKEAS